MKILLKKKAFTIDVIVLKKNFDWNLILFYFYYNKNKIFCSLKFIFSWFLLHFWLIDICNIQQQKSSNFCYVTQIFIAINRETNNKNKTQIKCRNNKQQWHWVSLKLSALIVLFAFWKKKHKWLCKTVYSIMCFSKYKHFSFFLSNPLVLNDTWQLISK